MVDPVGVALIGTGFWGRRMAQAVERTPSLRLVTCYSPSDEKRAAFAADFGCVAAESFEAAISHPDVEGALLITPNGIHRAQAEACAARGIHVFLEKPIADTLPDGAAIGEACASAGITLLVGHAFRRLGAARKTKSLIEEGALGTVVLAEANWSLPGRLTPDRWRYYRDTCPGGPLMQLGVHHADTLQYLLGPTTAVSGSFARLVTDAEIDDVGSAQISFASGARGIINSSYVSPKTYTIKLYGSETNLEYVTAMSIWPNAPAMDSNTTLTLIHKDGERESIAFEDVDMQMDELDEFARCVRGEALPETGAVEGIAALAVIRGAIESHETGQTVPLQIGNG